MSDFIFSKDNVTNSKLESALIKINKSYINRVQIKETNFGKLAYVKNHYKGLGEIETKDEIFIIIGGPLLTFKHEMGLNNNYKTLAIYKKIFIEKNIVFDEDLSGPFCFFYLNKITGDYKIITDLLSFIPVYYNEQKYSIYGTHLTSLNNIEKSENDNISIAEFVIKETVTFPHTIKSDYKQLAPGSLFDFIHADNNFKKQTYWVPSEPVNQIPMRFLTHKLREGFKSYLNILQIENENIAVFVSGGEDSRCVASHLYRKSKGYTFSDGFNIETKVTKKVCTTLGIKFDVIIRNKNAYLKIFKEAIDLIGPGNDYAHSHTLAINKKIKLNRYDAVLGGFLADTLLKAHHVKFYKINKLLSFLPIPSIISKKKTINHDVYKIIDHTLLKKVKKREIKHENWIKSFRKHSFKEWSNIYPITMHNDTSNIHCNRRLFRSYEPFTSNEVIKVASLASQKQKKDRKLFQKSFKTSFFKTYHIPSTNGQFPYLPWYFNNFLSFIKSIENKVKKTSTSNTSWCDWDYLMSSELSKEIELKNKTNFKKKANGIFNKKYDFEIISRDDINSRTKRLLLQVSYFLD